MKFIYQYRTPNNKQHKAFITAPTKEAAYAALKAQGIKPGRVEEAPGFFNKLFGKGKRWMAIGVLGALCFVLCAVVYTQGTRHKAQGTFLVHMDLYRLHDEDDVIAIGWEDFLAEGAILVVEWPERAGSLIPADAKHVVFTHLDGEEARRIVFK